MIQQFKIERTEQTTELNAAWRERESCYANSAEFYQLLLGIVGRLVKV